MWLADLCVLLSYIGLVKRGRFLGGRVTIGTARRAGISLARDVEKKKQVTIYILFWDGRPWETRQAKPNAQVLGGGGSRDDLDNHCNQSIQTCVPWACSVRGIGFITSSKYEDRTTFSRGSAMN